MKQKCRVKVSKSDVLESQLYKILIKLKPLEEAKEKIVVEMLKQKVESDYNYINRNKWTYSELSALTGYSTTQLYNITAKYKIKRK